MRYQFDSFLFDTDARQLTTAGHEVRLSAKAIDLLRILIESRPRVVNKRDLLDALWPDTYVVDGSLPVVVRELRIALAASSNAVRTVHGFGYAFAAPAREWHDDAERSATAAHELRHAGHVFPLTRGMNIIGRDPAAAVFIASTSVSRHHAAIAVEEGRATIEDLGSKNGTRVDGVPITKPTALPPVAMIRVGMIELAYSCALSNADTETVHE